MDIKFKCQNHCQDFIKTEEELNKEKVISHCPYCGLRLKVENIQEIVLEDTKRTVKIHIDNYIRNLGLEGTLELVERNKTTPGINLYVDYFRQKGLMK